MPDSSNIYKEIRIALVLYGGVALATYIHGACRELFELVKAARGEESSYRGIVQDLQANVTVDIISGASAGGLNGVAMAKALVLGSNFEELEHFWIKEAQIQQLLNNPRRPELESLLDEEYYERRLKDALKKLDRSVVATRVKALDLFLSTTDLHGNGETYTGFDGDAVYTKTHQYPLVYRFRQEGGSDDSDFREKNQALPKLWEACRATSAFPLAFPPAEVQVQGDVKRYLSDGGILNNHPFDQAIEAIALRPATVYVDRALFYVEPDPSFTKELSHNK